MKPDYSSPFRAASTVSDQAEELQDPGSLAKEAGSEQAGKPQRGRRSVIFHPFLSALVAPRALRRRTPPDLTFNNLSALTRNATQSAAGVRPFVLGDCTCVRIWGCV